jgi:hypothetical protein
VEYEYQPTKENRAIRQSIIRRNCGSAVLLAQEEEDELDSTAPKMYVGNHRQRGQDT